MPFNSNPTGDAALDGHYYIDLDHYDDLGLFTDYITILPENLQFGDQINGAGDVSWQLTFSATDIEDNPVIVHNGQANPGLQPYLTGPWWSWYRLRCGSTVIHAGVISNFNVKHGEQYISFAGKTWEAYFSRWLYPFDPREGHWWDWAYPKAFQGNELFPSGRVLQDTAAVYEAYNRDTTMIMTDILQKAMMEVDYRLQFGEGHIVNSGVTTNHNISPGETNTIEQMINDLASTGNGFDWWISHDQFINTGTPHRYGNMNSPDIAYYIDKDTPGILNLEWDNQGIIANHVFARGAGTSTGTTLGAAFGYEMMQARYTRLDTAVDWTGFNIKNQAKLEAKAHRELALDLDALITVSLSLDPALIPNFWETFRKGRAIHIYDDMYFHLVNSPHQIKSFSCQVTNEGNAKVDFGLEHIYPYTYDVGNPDF